MGSVAEIIFEISTTLEKNCLLKYIHPIRRKKDCFYGSLSTICNTRLTGLTNHRSLWLDHVYIIQLRHWHRWKEGEIVDRNCSRELCLLSVFIANIDRSKAIFVQINLSLFVTKTLKKYLFQNEKQKNCDEMRQNLFISDFKSIFKSSFVPTKHTLCIFFSIK